MNFSQASGHKALCLIAEEKFVAEQFYHDDFFTPGISPLFASSLKQILQRPNFRIYPLLLPHLKQRRTVLLLYFGFLLALMICDVVAILFYWKTQQFK